MRVLAEYVMKGRTQAVITAVLTTGSVLLAWVGAAVIGLLTLRRGPAQSSQVLLWAMLPAVVLAGFDEPGPLSTLLGMMLVATVLRSTVSWPWALAAAVVSGLVTGLVLATVGQGYVEQILQLFTQTVEQMRSERGAESVPEFEMPGAVQLAGLLGLSNAFTVVMCLLLARWWQALLYNPGGFRAEFHNLRLPPMLTVGLLAVASVVILLGDDYRLWALLFALPFLFAGFGLVHGLAGRKGIGGNWLGLFYIAWLLVDPLKMLLLLLAVADSWLDFRARVGNPPAPPGPEA